jgi:hypothetical protein
VVFTKGMLISDALMKYHAGFLLSILDRTGVPPLKTLAAQPGMKAVYRVVAYYADRRAQHSVATLVDERMSASPRLEVVYEGFRQHQPMDYSVTFADYAALVTAFGRVNFDKLQDQAEPQEQLLALWLVERATGTFYHSVIFSPHKPVLPYSLLINAIDAYLPDAIKEMKP